MLIVELSKNSEYAKIKYALEILIDRIGVVFLEEIHLILNEEYLDINQVDILVEVLDNRFEKKYLIISRQLLSNIYDFLVLKKEEKYSIGKNHCFPFELLNDLDKEQVKLPTLDIIADKIKENLLLMLKTHHISFNVIQSPWSTPTVLLSHDVDALYGKSILRYLFWLVLALKKPKLYLAKIFWWINQRNDLYFNIEEMIKIESKYNFSSTFFFMSLEKYITLHEARRYSIFSQEVRKLILKVYDLGWEVGLHPSRKSFKNIERLKFEFNELSKVVPIKGIRRHYLKGYYPDIWNESEELNLEYDSTCGYTRYAGFRCTTTRPFHTFCSISNKKLNLIEIPLIIMDMNFNANYEEDYLKQFFERFDVAIKTGVTTINWHNEMFCNEIFALKWKDIYLKILNEWKNRGLRVTSIEKFVNEYKKYNIEILSNIKWI